MPVTAASSSGATPTGSMAEATTATATSSSTTTTTGVGDFVELVDAKTGRVFFWSDALQVARWGLPLEGLAPGQAGEPQHDAAVSQLKGWCLHVDPSSQRKFFANEAKFATQWDMPDVVHELAKDKPYLKEKRSWAVQRQQAHNRAAPRSSVTESGAAVTAPATRRLTLRMLVQRLTLDKVFSDAELFRAFMLFSGTYHSEENVLFWCVVEAFAHRGEKSVDVLGLDDTAKLGHRGLPRTQSHLNQITLDSKRAEKMGTTLERIQLVREATAIYDRFLAPGAPDWVCVDQKIVESIHAQLIKAREDVAAPLSRKLFNPAQRAVFRNLEHDLLPRFIKAVLASDSVSSAAAAAANPASPSLSPSSEKGPAPSSAKFVADEVLRHHLLQVQKKPEGLTALMTTANAYKSLHPSPRYVIEGRQGSGLSPNALTSVDRSDTSPSSSSLGANGEVLAQPPASFTTGGRRPSSIRSALRPFSGRLFGQSIDGGGSKSSRALSVASGAPSASLATRKSGKLPAAAAADRRNSTGMNRANAVADKPGSKHDDNDDDLIVTLAAGEARTRARSKSDTDANVEDLYGRPPDLDVEFTVPVAE